MNTISTPDVTYPLAEDSWDDSEREALYRVIRSGKYTMGAEVAKYEGQFARWLGAKYCVMVNSGSSANLLMVAALTHHRGGELQRGDIAVVPAVSWPTTYYPLSQYGLRMRFVDIDLNTLNYDPEALEQAFDDRVKLVVAVNLLGNPNDFRHLKHLAMAHGSIIVEDNCEALGARFDDQFTGTFGVMGSFSSFFSHHISTMEGGAICTDDEELYHILLAIRAHGWTRDLPHRNLLTGTKSAVPFDESFHFVLPGYNVRPLEMQGAVGQVQLQKLPAFLTARRNNAAYMRDVLGSSRLVFLQEQVGESSWFGFSLVLRPNCPLSRRELAEALAKNGIECRPIVAGNFAKNPVMRLLDHEIAGELHNAAYIDARGLFIGNSHLDLRRQIDLIGAIFRDLE